MKKKHFAVWRCNEAIHKELKDFDKCSSDPLYFESDIMSKYDNLIYYKQTKARTEHNCTNCHQLIEAGDTYYAENIKDKFLHSLHRKKFCKQCYQASAHDMGELNNALDT